MARAFVLGSNFVFSVAGMTALGWALERWVWPKATPWLILAGCVLGLVGGTYNFIRQGNRENR
jgi:F0F1-type ATP synthase assembly protein I